MAPAPRPVDRRVLVIGGGISGLAAAHRLLERGARVTVLEASARLGGKLRVGEVAGSPVDLGAESMLARRPEGVELARAVGLEAALQPPALANSAIWVGGALRPLPRAQLMGVPADPAALAEVLTPAGLARAARDAELPATPVGEDTALGGHVAERLGREVVDRLVEPLLGGVYAGDAYRTSMRAALPQLFDAVQRERSLLTAVREVQRRAAGSPAAASGAPVFLGIAGGVGRLPLAVADACRAAGAHLHTGVEVRGLHRGPQGWRAVAGDGRHWEADAVVLAVPAPAAARLLVAEVPAAAGELRSVEYASMALVTLTFRRADLDTPNAPGAPHPTGGPGDGAPDGTAARQAGDRGGSELVRRSGFLVPPVERRTIKAATFSATKWDWVAAQDPELFVLRTSIGRYAEQTAVDRPDEALVTASLTDLRDAVGLTAAPVATRVTRWHQGLPQYPVGHVHRVERIRAAVDQVPGLALCGAVYQGVGIPACVASGRAAAESVLDTSHPGAPGDRPRARMAP